jgi:drug/metabolite transporter (DMT)-like permease
MPWQVFIVANVIVSAFRSLQSGKIGRYREDVTLYAMSLSFLLQFFIAIAFVIISSGSLNHSGAWEARYFIFFGAFLYTTLNIVFLSLFRIAAASIVVLVSLLNPVAVIVVATTFSGETLTSRQIIGVVAILLAVLLAGLLTKHHPQVLNKSKRNSSMKLIGLSFAVAVMYGFAVINEKYLINRLELPTYFLYGVGAQVMFATMYLYTLRTRITLKLPLNVHYNVWLYAALLAISGLFFLLSLNYSNSSSLTAMGSSAKVALTVLLAYFLLHEKEDLILKAVSLSLSILGLFLLFT